MREIFRAYNSEVVDLFRQHLQTDETITKDEVCQIIKDRILSDDTCVFVAFDDNQLVGFLVCWIINDYLWVDNAWSKSDASYEIWKMTQEWAKEKGCKYIECQVSERVEAMERRTGMKVCLYVLRKEL